MIPDIVNTKLNVFNFHPIHIYLNTDKYSRYEQAKNDFNLPSIKKYINDKKGINTLLVSLFKEIKLNKIKTCLLKELINEKMPTDEN